MKILFLIISCENHINTRQNWLKNTWLNNLDYAFLSDIDSADNVCVTRAKGHISGEEKQIMGIDYANKSNNYDWYFFCDDDTYVNTKNLISHIGCLDNSCNSCGLVFSEETHPDNPIWPYVEKGHRYYSGGSGFALRKDLINRINSKIDIPKTNYGDVTLGYYLKGEKLYSSNRFNQNNYLHLKHDLHQIKHNISYHYMNEKMMKEINSICKEK